jgi:hypothetical protein
MLLMQALLATSYLGLAFAVLRRVREERFELPTGVEVAR